MSMYADWMDELLERGFYLSEFKKLLKEKFPDKDLNLLWRFIQRRRRQGWRIEIRREGKDTFYKVVSKPDAWKERRGVERLVDEAIKMGLVGGVVNNVQDVEVKRERVFCGMGMYMLRKEGDRSVLEVKVGTESNVVECGEGEDVVDVLKRLFGMDVEIKKVERVGGVEKGVFGLYAEV
jgi:hypothetical protein